MFCRSGEQIVGLDIGGANLKAAVWMDVNHARAASINFPMWKQPELLASAVHKLLHQLNITGPAMSLAVTMTGELADCFASRREGVDRIIAQLCQVASADRLSIYTVDGRWFTAEQAKEDPWTVAASNWHASASWLAQWPTTARFCQCAVLVDIGSTTVDVVPMLDGRVATDARTDRDRLRLSQLVYTGVRRTPVCAVLPYATLDGTQLPLMAELFATVDDAYLLLGEVTEDTEDNDSADGRARTKPFAAMRLARMIGEDAERLSRSQLEDLANQVIEAQTHLVGKAIEKNLNQLRDRAFKPHLICCGHGLPLWERSIRNVKSQCSIVQLDSILSEEVSRCAPAAAVAWLCATNSISYQGITHGTD